MTLQDYTTEELRAELKRRSDLAKAEKAKVKRCRMCKHFGLIDIYGKKLTASEIEFYSCFNFSRPCKFSRTKNGERYKCHKPSQPACEHFEPHIKVLVLNRFKTIK